MKLDDLPLTPDQRAAMAIDGDLVVRAGAGSGKTHTLAWRYVHLQASLAERGQARPDAVLVLTFTEKAAAEMAERCERRLEEVGGFEALVARFRQASIVTFHGFCARIAREFPGWVGIPGDARILDPDEAVTLRQEAVQGAFDRALVEDPAMLTHLLDTFGSRRAVLAALDSALARHGVLRDRLAEHANGPLPLPVADTARWRAWLERTGLPTLRAVRKLTRAGDRPVSRALDAWLGPPPNDDLALHRRVERTLASLLTSDGKLRTLHHPSLLGTKATWRDLRRYGQARNALQVLQERCADWPELHREARHLPTPADRLLYDALVPFARLVETARARQLSAFRSERVVDFDRLLDAAVDAVAEHAELRHILRQRHRYLMVDEFQDTDSRQWEMVQHLREEGVFLVGDVKQAIYSFRGGEARLFAEAADALGVRPIGMNDNFRTAPAVIDWLNQVLPRIVPEHWTPIRAVRTDPGRVRWLEADDLEQQCEQLCAFLQRHDGPVAVLFRTRTRLGTWERALRTAGIPYQVAKGVGFWERPEVRDVCNLAHAWITDTTLSWVGVWRSPLVAASEAEVHTAVIEGVRTEAMLRVSERGSLLHMPLSSALDRVLDRSVWDPHARANVELLLQRIDGWGGTLPEIAQRLHSAVRSGPRESEAPGAPHAARVVLMTVHAAKGLEFDTVVIPELDRASRSRPASLQVAHLEGRWELAAAVDDPDAVVQSRVVPGLLARLRDHQRTQAAAESARLLYVALTRARDQLVLIGPKTERSGSWASLLEDAPTRCERLPPPQTSGTDTRMRWSTCTPAHRPSPTDVELTASDLSSAQSCAVRWFRSRQGQNPSEPSRAGLLGSVLHSLIEHRQLDLTLAERRWRQCSTALTRDEQRAGLRMLRVQVPLLASDPQLAQVLSAPGFDELPFRNPFPGGVFTGRIDRLYIDRERGGFLVLDFKSRSSGQVRPGERMQLRAYAWAAGAVLEAQEQPGVVGAQIYFMGDRQLVDVAIEPGPPPLLHQLAQMQDLEAARAYTEDAPCAECPLLGLCPGIP